MVLSSHSKPLKLHYMFHIKLVDRVTYRELKSVKGSSTIFVPLKIYIYSIIRIKISF